MPALSKEWEYPPSINRQIILVRHSFLVIACVLFMRIHSIAQTVDISIVSNPNIEFKFNTVSKLVNGIVFPDAITFNIVAVGTQWDLYAGSVTGTPGVWDNAQYYTSSGNGFPPVNLLEMRVHNLSSTSKISGYVTMQDINTTTLDIIGDHMNAPDPPINCSDAAHTGTNTPGTYVLDPQCYQFKVDLKCTPGIQYRPGVYTLELEFIVAPDL